MSQNDRTTQSRRLIALVVALAVHLVLGVILWRMHLSSQYTAPKLAQVEVLTEIPRPEALTEGEQAINAGNVPEASGAIEPGGTPEPEMTKPHPAEPTPPTPPAPKPAPAPKPTKAQPAEPAKAAPQRTQPSAPLQTQSHEPSLPQSSSKPTKEQQLKLQQAQREAAEAKRRAAEAEAKRRADEAAARAAAEAAAKEAAAKEAAARRVAGAFGKKAGSAGSQGTSASGAGNQGDPGGSAHSYALTGRKLVSNGGVLFSPTVSRSIAGTVAIRIIVDGEGRVTQASVSPRGTNIADPAVRRVALDAARRNRFNTVRGSEDQEGTIIYHFRIRTGA